MAGAANSRRATLLCWRRHAICRPTTLRHDTAATAATTAVSTADSISSRSIPQAPDALLAYAHSYALVSICCRDRLWHQGRVPELLFLSFTLLVTCDFLVHLGHGHFAAEVGIAHLQVLIIAFISLVSDFPIRWDA